MFFEKPAKPNKRIGSMVVSGFLLAAVSFAFAASTSARAEAPYSVSESELLLNKFINSVDTFEANFTQMQTDESGEVLQRSSGYFLLQRPGKFVWKYVKPYEQLIVSDAKTISLYDPDLFQVTQRSAKEALEGTPAALLAQGGNLYSAYTVSSVAELEGAPGIRLTPKSDAGDFKQIDLWLEDSSPKFMRFSDHLGGRTDVIFKDRKTNTKIDSAKFKFVVPEGVEVVTAE